MENYQKLIEEIRSAVPEIIKEVGVIGLGNNMVYGQWRAIGIADVLLSINKSKTSYEYAVTSNGEFIKSEDIYRYNYTPEIIQWDLRDDNLDHQSEKMKQYLIDLLINH